MKCSKCGTRLSEDAKFCSRCGNKIEVPPRLTGADTLQTSLDEPARVPQGQIQTSKPLYNKMSENASTKWGKLSTYGKIVTVALSIFVLLFIVALLTRKAFPVVIAVIQIVLAVISILMHKTVIKLEQKKLWLKWLVLVIAVLLTILSIRSYLWSFGSPDRPANNPVPSVSIPSVSIPPVSVTAPYGADECVGQDYSAIQATFESAGFTNVKAEKIEDLKATDADRVGAIDSIFIGGKPDFTKDQEFKADDEVIIRYHNYAMCNVTIHIDFVPNFIFSKYDVNLLLNGIEKGTLSHGENQDLKLSVYPGEYTLAFESDESSSVKGEVMLAVDCDVEAAYKISCYSDKVSIETMYVDRLTELADGEVKVDVAASEYRVKNYEEVSTALRTLGFTNIQYEVLYDIVLGWTSEGEVESVSIAGKTDFHRGDVFPADAEIIITYHMPEDDDPNTPVESEPIESETATPSTRPSETGSPTVSEKKPSSQIVFPQSESKLGKDFDSKGSTTAYYINVDGVTNVPTLETWETAIVTDGVVEYINYLEALGFTVTVTDTHNSEPYSGFHMYETNFEISGSDIVWKMYLYIQDEDYIEYQLDIYLQ